jgi:DNA-directed RNA polymerase II subunit RPB1
MLMSQDNNKFKQALKIRNSKNRLRRIYDACKSKKFCGGDDPRIQERQDTGEPVRKRGCCGAMQPNITVDGMKMIVEFKAPKKNDDKEKPSEPVERKQILSAERVYITSQFNKLF